MSFIIYEKIFRWLKIRFIKINNILSNIEENSQRNYIREILLNDFNSEDFILALCDVDEFYNKEFYNKDKLFNELNKNVIFLKMNMYYYNFHFFIDNEWTMAFFINSNMLKKYTDLNYIRVNKIPNHTIRHNNGWHFSYFMKPQEIQRKLISFLHNDLNRSPYNNIDYLNFCVKNGIDFLLRDHIKIKKIPFEDPLHSYPELFRKYYNS
jgi:hypothetical protein